MVAVLVAANRYEGLPPTLEERQDDLDAWLASEPADLDPERVELLTALGIG